jgi:hypothetical protein
VPHDDHFHCFAFPSGVTPGKTGSAVRTDTWKRGGANVKPGVKPDIELYSLTEDLGALVFAQNKKLPDSARLDTAGASVGGRDLHVLKLGANINGEPKRRVLFTGGLHAREWLSTTYTYLIAEWLVTNHPGGAAAPDNLQRIAKDLLDNTHVWFVPMCNPDGHEYTVTTARIFRKNSPAGDKDFRVAPGARAKRDPKAPDATDLNRNFDTAQWKAIHASRHGSFSSDPDSERFGGKSPADTVEVQLLQKLITGTAFDLAVDHHTFGCDISFPLADDAAKAAEDARLRMFTAAMQKQVNGKARLPKNFTTQPVADAWQVSKMSEFYASLGLALPIDSPFPGSITDFIVYQAQAAKRKTVAFVMELPPMHHDGTPGFTPDESIIRPVFRQLIGTSLWLIKNAAEPNPAGAAFTPFDAVAP